MKTNNIMIRIEKFLTGEKEQQLFYSIGKEVKVRKGWVTIENLNQGKEENVSILTDDEKNELFSLRRECARSHYPKTVQTKQDEDIGREC